jgi:hypothetical protein
MLVAVVVVQRVGQQPLVVAAAAEMVQILQQLAVPVPIILVVAVAVLALVMPAQVVQVW